MMKFDKLPVEIQEKMLEEQVKQGYPKNPEIFRKDIMSRRYGFSWDSTKEDYYFWRNILCNGLIDTFYTKYPRKKINIQLYL